MQEENFSCERSKTVLCDLKSGGMHQRKQKAEVRVEEAYSLVKGVR